MRNDLGNQPRFGLNVNFQEFQCERELRIQGGFQYEKHELELIEMFFQLTRNTNKNLNISVYKISVQNQRKLVKLEKLNSNSKYIFHSFWKKNGKIAFIRIFHYYKCSSIIEKEQGTSSSNQELKEIKITRHPHRNLNIFSIQTLWNCDDDEVARKRENIIPINFIINFRTASSSGNTKKNRNFPNSSQIWRTAESESELFVDNTEKTHISIVFFLCSFCANLRNSSASAQTNRHLGINVYDKWDFHDFEY